MFRTLRSLLVLGAVACGTPQGTEPPPDGWANLAPTRVERAVDLDGAQLLEVSQGPVRTWVRVPDVGATPGAYVLLGRGTLSRGVEVPGVGPVPELVGIEHIQVVDRATAEATVQAAVPDDAVAIGTLYAELDERADDEVVVHGVVVKAPQAIGWTWVHLRDGTGDPADGTHDLTVRTDEPVAVGQRVAFRGTLRRDVDLGFGYRYDALVEGGRRALSDR